MLCLAYDYDWPLVVGGKTPGIYSLPAYVVIGFEMTIMLGGLGTILGMLLLCKLPDPRHPVMDTRLTSDHFAIFIPAVDKDSKQVKALLACGADEVKEF